ncbi:hypothetical protein GCM10023235_09310 [Kitasatospora terrestris]|uniref:Transposase n=1 Tax=Kitasatospora terrestris TaxID=258051 RepID=A0ABP9DE64_9ACTN
MRWRRIVQGRIGGAAPSRGHLPGMRPAQGCAVSRKLCAAELSQVRWTSWTELVAAVVATARHLALCRATKCWAPFAS